MIGPEGLFSTADGLLIIAPDGLFITGTADKRAFGCSVKIVELLTTAHANPNSPQIKGAS